MNCAKLLFKNIDFTTLLVPVVNYDPKKWFYEENQKKT